MSLQAKLFRVATPVTAMTFRGFAAVSKNTPFDTVAREWRMKWSTDNDKKSLDEVQA